jgi:hypothetical protein
MTTKKMKTINQAVADTLLEAALFLLLLLRYSFTFLTFSPVAFSDKMQAISLLEPGGQLILSDGGSGESVSVPIMHLD